METKSNIFETRMLEKGGRREHWINSAGNSADGDSLIRNAVDRLKTLDAEPVSIRLFGNRHCMGQAIGNPPNFHAAPRAVVETKI